MTKGKQCDYDWRGNHWDSWLSPAEKDHEVRHLQRAITDALEGGESPVDLPFVPYLNEINELPWVVTTECCTGHRRSINWWKFFKHTWKWRAHHWEEGFLLSVLKTFRYLRSEERDKEGYLKLFVTKPYYLRMIKLARRFCRRELFTDVWISRGGCIGDITVWFDRDDFPEVIKKLIWAMKKLPK